jgi:hypothetical protein
LSRIADGATVYVAELSNGAVKVGFSRNPRGRLYAVQTYARRHFRSHITRWHVSRVMKLDGDARYLERLMHSRLARIGQPLRGFGEYFLHARFEVARQLCDQLGRCMPKA